MLAKSSKYDEAKFTDADQKCPSSPRLHMHWGQASKRPSNPTRPPANTPNPAVEPELAGALLRTRKTRGRPRRLRRCTRAVQEAIRRDASFHAAHRERARLRLGLENDDSAAKLALGWAWTACDLCYFRDAESLAVLANAFADLKQWPEALRYQQMAIEDAPIDSGESTCTNGTTTRQDS